jgi:hypothetical protein
MEPSETFIDKANIIVVIQISATQMFFSNYISIIVVKYLITISSDKYMFNHTKIIIFISCKI